MLWFGLGTLSHKFMVGIEIVWNIFISFHVPNDCDTNLSDLSGNEIFFPYSLYSFMVQYMEVLLENFTIT
jgi:hypothetical protein